MARQLSTRLRYASGSSPEELEAIFNSLPFKVEIKSVVKDGKNWVCWFVLPDIVSHETYNGMLKTLQAKARQIKKLREVALS
jgi:hypothetical protein